MVIVTESGSQYRIFDDFCKKYDADGVMVDSFKVWTIKGIEPGQESWESIHESDAEVAVGKRMYISGKDSWWLTTPVVRLIP
jgi:hypothetical protein